MIRLYENKDFNDVRYITQYYWGKEVLMTKTLEDFIYDFLVRYYLIDNDLSYVYEEDNKVKAYAIASYKNEKNDSIDYFYKHLNFLNKDNQENAIKYLNYLEYNHQKVLNYMDDDDIYFALFASIKKHAGSMLLDNLLQVARKKQIKHLYFWTDETCNYAYYENKGFKKIEEYMVSLYEKQIKTFIYRIDL